MILELFFRNNYLVKPEKVNISKIYKLKLIQIVKYEKYSRNIYISKSAKYKKAFSRTF